MPWNVLMASWRRLGGVLEVLECVLEALGGVLEDLDAVLEAMLNQDSAKMPHKSKKSTKKLIKLMFFWGGVDGGGWLRPAQAHRGVLPLTPA